MASQLETPKVPLRMRRSQTSLPKITTSSPSAPPPNEPQTSKEGHSHKSHHHHHHWYAKDTIQSAIQLQNPFSFQDGRKQHSKHDQRTPAASEPGSRRPSVTPAKDANEENSTVKPVTQEDVFRERAKAKMREDELRGSLQQLSEHAFKTTRQLDETYYSILERNAQLRTTINALQELCSLTNQLRGGFKEEVNTLEEEVQAQIDTLRASEQQREKVEQLRARLGIGRGKADSLKNRLEAAGQRVNACEQKDKERQAKSNRRIRIFLSILGIISGLLFILIISYNVLASRSSSTDIVFYDEEDDMCAQDIALIGELPKEELLDPAQSPTFSRASQQSPRVSKEAVDDTWLRVLDEL